MFSIMIVKNVTIVVHSCCIKNCHSDSHSFRDKTEQRNTFFFFHFLV